MEGEDQSYTAKVEMRIPFSFPVCHEIWGISKVTYFSLWEVCKAHWSSLEDWIYSFGKDQSSDTSGEGSFLFIKVVRTHNGKLRFIDLGRLRDIGIFNKVFNFGCDMFITWFWKRKSRGKRNMRGGWWRSWSWRWSCFHVWWIFF